MRQRSVLNSNFRIRVGLRVGLFMIFCHIFVYNNINMTKIESRPVKGKQWEYRFFVDFDGSLEDAAVKNALRGLREEATNLRILGNY